MRNEMIFRNLVSMFGRERVSRDAAELQRASRDLCPGNLLEFGRTSFASVVVKPSGPKAVRNIQQLVLFALSCEPKLHIVARGGGSGVCGALDVRGSEIVLDMTDMHDTKILAYSTKEKEGRMLAQAGASGEHIDRALRFDGRRFTCGHYPASYYLSTFGGWVQCGASGQYSLRFGTIKNLAQRVCGINGLGEYVILEDEKLDRVIGMEGTSCIMTDGVLPIFEIPRYDGYASFSFDDIQDTGVFLKELFCMREMFDRYDTELLAVRCYDFFDYHGIAKPHKGDSYHADWRRYLEYLAERQLCKRGRLVKNALGVLERRKKAPWTGFVYYASCAKESRASAQKLLESIVLRCRGSMRDPAIGQLWHQNRFRMGYDKLIARLRAGSGITADTFDCAVLWNALGNTYEAVRETIAEFGIVGAHCGVDLEGPYLYFTFALPGRSEALYREAWEAILRSCVASGARTNHHHGIGRLKAGSGNSFAPFANGYEWYSLARLVKQEMDPYRILNPHNLV